MKIIIALFLLMGLALAPSVQAAETPEPMDILIVINSHKPDQVKQERELRTALEKSRALHELSSRDLPVDTYDVANAGQKAAVDRLKIPDWQLPFLGLAHLGANKIPDRVVFGGGPVDKMEEAVGATMQEAFKKLGVKIAASASPSASPSATATPAGAVPLGILLVQGEPLQTAMMARLKAAVLHDRDARGLTKDKLSLHFLHWNHSGGLLRELGINGRETPLICVVSLENGRPKKVLYRLANVKDPTQAAHDSISHAKALLEKSP